LIAGLGQLGHHPGEKFMSQFVKECQKAGLRTFSPEELCGLVVVSLQLLAMLAGGSVLIHYSPEQGFARLSHQPDSGFRVKLREVLVEHVHKGAVGEQVSAHLS
jgi:hypothetical protein